MENKTFCGATEEWKAKNEAEEALEETPEYKDFLEAKVSYGMANEALKYQEHRRKDFGFLWN